MGDYWYTLLLNPAFMLWAICTIVLTVGLVIAEPPPGKTPLPILVLVSTVISLFVSRGILSIVNYIDALIVTIAVITVLGTSYILAKKLRKD